MPAILASVISGAADVVARFGHAGLGTQQTVCALHGPDMRAAAERPRGSCRLGLLLTGFISDTNYTLAVFCRPEGWARRVTFTTRPLRLDFSIVSLELR